VENTEDTAENEKKATRKRNTRPKKSLSEILRGKIEKNTSKLSQKTAFDATVKYIKSCIPDSAIVGKISTSKKDGKYVVMLTVEGDIELESMAGSF
jgi:hypothetical protein